VNNGIIYANYIPIFFSNTERDLSIITTILHNIPDKYDGLHNLCIDKVDFEVWIKDGEIHRKDGPAVIFQFCKMYMENGKLHRTDGLAIDEDRSSGFTGEYYIEGKRIEPKIFPMISREYKLKSFLNG